MSKCDVLAPCDTFAKHLIGPKPGDVFHNAYGYGLFTGGLGFHYGAERLRLTTVPVSAHAAISGSQ